MIYLDNASTTKMDERVLEAMLPYLREKYGNPGTLYSLGREAAEAIDKARGYVADLLGARPEQIVFTSGGSESNNLALIGLEEHLRGNGSNRVIMSSIEHDSVLNTGKLLSRHGFHVELVNPSENGRVSASDVERLLDMYNDVGLVSVMHTNNETGIENNVAEIGRLCKERGVLFHTDCVQAAGCAVLDVDELNCDMLSISSHKIYGPKGVGALYVRDRAILSPVIAGGSAQEYGLRGGTENVAGIVGFGEACRLANENIQNDISAIQNAMASFVGILWAKLILKSLENRFHINGDAVVKGKTVNLRFDGVDAETLVLVLNANGVCVSAGSACRSHEMDPSHVLKAMGLTNEQARSSVRFSVSRDFKKSDAIKAAEIVADSVEMLIQRA